MPINMKKDKLPLKTKITLLVFGVCIPLTCLAFLSFTTDKVSTPQAKAASPPAHTSNHRPDWEFSERAARRRNVRECIKLYSEYCERAWIVPQLSPNKRRTAHGWKFTGFIRSKSGRLQERYEYLVKYGPDGLMYTYKYCGPC